MSAETNSGSGSDEDIRTDLDWKSLEILRAIYQNGGAANTTEVRTLTGIDSNGQVLYRFQEHLAPKGLITLEQPESDTARPEPKMATFTQQGVDVAEQLIDEQARPTDITSRVDKLEADIARVTDQIEQATTESPTTDAESDADLAELQTKTDQLLYQMGLIADFLNEQFDGGLSDYRARRENTENAGSVDD